MSPSALPFRRLLPAGVLSKRSARIERARSLLSDGARTTLHVATYERSAFRARVVALPEPAQLLRWCADNDVRHAIVGGFFLRPAYAPLGHLQVNGTPYPSAPFDPPWGDV